MPCFKFKNIFLSKIINFQLKNEIFYLFYSLFFLLLPKFSGFINFDNCIGKIYIKIYQTISRLYSKKDLKLIKKKKILEKKCEIQVIISMIMLIHSSEKIFNP